MNYRRRLQVVFFTDRSSLPLLVIYNLVWYWCWRLPSGVWCWMKKGWGQATGLCHCFIFPSMLGWLTGGISGC